MFSSPRSVHHPPSHGRKRLQIPAPGTRGPAGMHPPPDMICILLLLAMGESGYRSLLQEREDLLGCVCVLCVCVCVCVCV